MTQLRVFTDQDDARNSTPNGKLREAVGAMWRDPEQDIDGRECWAIILPNGGIWYTTERAGGTDNLWDVTGTPPNITVSPSIDDRWPGNAWHGWIRNGRLET